MKQQMSSETPGHLAFVMLNARPVDLNAAELEADGHYDPVSQTWTGSVYAQSSTYSTHGTAGGARATDQTHRRDD